MSTVLRVHGSRFDVDAFMENCTLPICAVWRSGEPVFPNSQPEGRRHDKSGVNIVTSESDFNEFSSQVAETTKFFEANTAQLRRLVDWPGVESADLDFGIERRDAIVQRDELPAELVRLAGLLGLGLVLSQYPASTQAERDVGDEPRLEVGD